MFERMIDDFKDSTGTALRLTSLAAAAAVALFITISFLCAAAFVYVLQKYGLIEACLTGAGVFLVVTLIAAGSYMVRKDRSRPARRRPRNRPCNPRWPIPMLVATGIQIDPRHRHQEADPDSGGRRIGAGISGQPRPRRATKRRRK